MKGIKIVKIPAKTFANSLKKDTLWFLQGSHKDFKDKSKMISC